MSADSLSLSGLRDFWYEVGSRAVSRRSLALRPRLATGLPERLLFGSWAGSDGWCTRLSRGGENWTKGRRVAGVWALPRCVVGRLAGYTLASDPESC